MENRRYFISLLPPVLWICLTQLLVVCRLLPPNGMPYWNVLFFSGFIVYALWRKKQSPASFVRTLAAGWKKPRFWLAVLFTVAGMALAYGASLLLPLLIAPSAVPAGRMRISTPSGLLAFGVSTILLAPLGEELFYRGMVIRFDGNKTLVLSSLLNLLLFGIGYSLDPPSLLKSMVWGIPFTIAYLATRNLNVPIAAHFICNLMMNGADVLSAAHRLASGG